jgi:hypothetical protein
VRLGKSAECRESGDGGQERSNATSARHPHDRWSMS